MEYSGAGGKLIHEKNQKQKISWHCPFKFKNHCSLLCRLQDAKYFIFCRFSPTLYFLVIKQKGASTRKGSVFYLNYSGGWNIEFGNCMQSRACSATKKNFKKGDNIKKPFVFCDPCTHQGLSSHTVPLSEQSNLMRQYILAFNLTVQNSYVVFFKSKVWRRKISCTLLMVFQQQKILDTPESFAMFHKCVIFNCLTLWIRNVL
jgi:hypothetical protein